MMKKILSIFLCCLMAVIMTSCNGNAGATSSENDGLIYSVDDTQPVVLEELPSSEAVSEDTLPEVSTIDFGEEDLYAVYKTPKEWAENHPDYFSFLEKEDSYYSLSSSTMKEKSDVNYNTGVVSDYDDDMKLISVYDTFVENNDRYAISFGDALPLLVKRDDVVLDYRGARNHQIKLYSVYWYGYGIGFYGQGDDYDVVVDTASRTYTSIAKSKDCHVETTAGEWFGGDIHDMKKGEKCILVHGDEKIELVADCNIYVIGTESYWESRPDYVIDGIIGSDGVVVTYDFSGVEPGLYYTSCGGVIQIQ